MNYDKIAHELANKFVRKSIFDMTNEDLKVERFFAKVHALECVKQIISSLKTTIGHCTLNELDSFEVKNDLEYWNNVSLSLKEL